MSAMLPSLDRAAEDAFVAAWRDSEELEGLVELVTAALEAGRPQLAGRLVGLLEGRVEIEPGSALAKAQAIARLVVVGKPEEAFALSEELERAWYEARRAQLRAVRARVRDRYREGSGVFLDGGAPKHRLPHLSGGKRRG